MLEYTLVQNGVVEYTLVQYSMLKSITTQHGRVFYVIEWYRTWFSSTKGKLTSLRRRSRQLGQIGDPSCLHWGNCFWSLLLCSLYCVQLSTFSSQYIALKLFGVIYRVKGTRNRILLMYFPFFMLSTIHNKINS